VLGCLACGVGLSHPSSWLVHMMTTCLKVRRGKPNLYYLGSNLTPENLKLLIIKIEAYIRHDLLSKSRI
jgi:hypothetical protein